MLNMNTSETYFFSSTAIEWNNDYDIRNLKKRIFKFIRPSSDSTFNVHNPLGIKLLTRLRVGLSHLREKQI